MSCPCIMITSIVTPSPLPCVNVYMRGQASAKHDDCILYILSLMYAVACLDLFMV